VWHSRATLDPRREEVVPGPWAWLGPPLTVVAGMLSAWASWRCWINPFVDSSREMNVPARLAAGERLYRDVVYHYGPAGPWINALSIGIFGRRFAALELTGLLAGILLLVSLYRLAARAGSALAAGAATVLAAALCVGAPNGGAFLFPYSFGSLFALGGSFLCLERSARPVSPPSLGLAALGLCLAFTAKPEIGAAAAAVLIVALLRSEDRRGEARRTLPILVGGAALAAVGYAVAFAGLSWRDLSPEGPMALFHPPREWRSVYREVSGLGNPAASASGIATALFLDLVVLAPLMLLVRRLSWRFAGAVWGILLVCGTLFFCLPVGGAIEDRLAPLFCPMPILSALAALLLLRRPLDPRRRARFLLFGFAAAIASRVFFGLTYGAVTTPYAILAFSGLAAAAAVLLIDGTPPSLSSSVLWRAGVAALFVSLAVVAVARWKRLQPDSRRVPVVTGAGTLRLPPDRALAVVETLAYLKQRARPGDGLAGFPEVGLFNFVTGLANPLRQEQVLPGHLDAEGERRVALRIARSGPRFILLANQSVAVFGPTAFGRDYAMLLWQEVERRYQVAASIGASPQAPVGLPPFFLRVYERKEKTP
jgi:4-amino-4-deoxy-L-arabinose transferase-like glycosyltransferase